MSGTADADPMFHDPGDGDYRLRPGSPADLALFQIEQGDFTFQDVLMAERKATQRLVSISTLVDGVPLPRVPERPLQPWAGLPERQRGNVIPLVPVPPLPPAPWLNR